MIDIQKLTTCFPNGKGVFDVTLTVGKGEVFGFLGPNGAGKTTTIRHLMSLLKPQKGSCRIMNLDCWGHEKEIQRHVGYLPGEMAFFDGETAMGHLKNLAALHGLSDTKKRDELIDRFALDTSGKIKKMSKGMKQKLGIVGAFMKQPEIYLLDEPTSGLDPLMQAEFLTLLREEQARGCTVFLSSHLFEEVEKACTKVGIIKAGRIVATEDVSRLKEVSRKTYLVRVAGDADEQALQASGFPVQKIAPRTYEITLSGDLSAFFRLLAGCHVQSFDPEKKGLEETFIQYYQEANHESHSA